MREIESAIQQLDIRRQQVLIEAAIIEVSGDDADQLGIQWALGDLSSGIGLLSFSNIGASLSSIAAGYLSSGTAGAANAIAAGKNKGDGATFAVGNFENSRKAYGALIQALKTNTKSNLLSTPSIVTMDNEEAYIVVGQNVPFVTGSVSTGSSGTVNPYTTVERKDVGVTLKVIPHIGEGGTVRLEVEQEVSNVQSSKGQAADLITNKRAIKTAVLAEHGQTVVLGGLVSDDVEFNNQGIPGLSSIPYLGRLFRSDTRSNVKRNLLVLFIQQLWVMQMMCVVCLSSAITSFTAYNWRWIKMAILPNSLNKLMMSIIKDGATKCCSSAKNYQQVPSGGKSSTVITPVAVEPAVRKQTLQLPEPEINRTKNTVTTTTLRPSTAP